ncbi:EAL domain-containing protein [Oribacterium sp. Sow4_G1_1]|uniref:EAL domain-containing protein n=1 Tax=Oribacterium sp. Sow4_G1_1 TaxID=3438794 RepID=UPI003F9754FC
MKKEMAGDKKNLQSGRRNVEKLFYDMITELHIREGFAQITYQNPALFAFPTTPFGYYEAREHFLRQEVYGEDADRVENFWNGDKVRTFLGNGSLPAMQKIEFRMHTKKGLRWVEQVAFFASDEGRQGGLMVLLRDITDAKGERMDALNEKDRLQREKIGLPDIFTFYQNAEALLAQYPEKKFLLFTTDINNLKLYEAIYGEEKSEALLMMAADELKKQLQTTLGTAGYLGGDYFCYMFATERDTREVVEIVQKTIQQLADATMGFSESVGIYEITDRSEHIENMYDKSLLALNTVRYNHKENIAVFRPNMFMSKDREAAMIQDIIRGIQAGEFTFYTQPVVDISCGKPVSMEALVRWVKDGHVISPGEYIPLLERSGYVVMLDQYIWERVFERQRAMLDQGVETITCSVNVSRIDFELIDVAQLFASLKEKYRIDPQMIGIEVTESAYVDNYDRVQKTVSRLHELGFRIYLDDFGSGYSNLNSLSDMKLDILKLDMKFVQGKDEQKTIKIMESIINMAHLLNLPVVCEGVETEAQLRMVKALGIYYVQGYYYYRPFPYDRMEEILREGGRVETEGIRLHPANRIHMVEMFDDNVYSDTLLNHILGPVAFYEMDPEKHVELVRVNDLYYSIVGSEALVDENYRNHITDYVINKEDIVHLLEAAEVDALTGSQADILYKRADGKIMMIHAHAFFISKSSDGIGRYFVSLRNFTVLYDKIRKEVTAEIGQGETGRPGCAVASAKRKS